MRKWALRAAICIASITAPFAAGAQEEPETRPDAPAQVAYPDGVTGFRDVPFSILAGYRPVTLDLYRPALGGATKPAVIFIHGGGWNKRTAREGGTFPNFPATLAALAARGYVVASVNYRLSSEAKYPAQLHDVQASIRWLRSHAADYNIDVDRFVVWGSSAGGHMASLIGTGCGVAALEAPVPANAKGPLPSACVQGVIDWYGVIDFEQLARDAGTKPLPGYVGTYLGCEPLQCPPGFLRSLNAMSYIDRSDPPFLIQHGASDVTVSTKQAQNLDAALRVAGVSSQLVIYPNVAHGFTRVPASADARKLPGWQVDEAVNRKAMEDVVAFLDKLFPKRP